MELGLWYSKSVETSCVYTAGLILDETAMSSHRVPGNLVVSGFIWDRIVEPSQHQWHFFQDVLSGVATPSVTVWLTYPIISRFAAGLHASFLTHHNRMHAFLLPQLLLRGACFDYRNSWCSGGGFKASKCNCTEVAGLHRSTGRNATAPMRCLSSRPCSCGKSFLPKNVC